MFRATRVTALVAGFSTVISIELIQEMRLSTACIALPFYGFAITGVVGIPQMQELQAERKRRGSYLLLEPGDLKTYYVPVWGRMFLWFVGCVITGIIKKAANL